MEINVLGSEGGVLRLEVVGRIVRDSITPHFEAMEKALGSDGYAQRVVLNMARTQFMDSTGISWLVVCHKRFRTAGGKLVIHSLTPSILTLLKMMRLDLSLDMAENEEEALQLAAQDD